MDPSTTDVLVLTRGKELVAWIPFRRPHKRTIVFQKGAVRVDCADVVRLMLAVRFPQVKRYERVSDDLVVRGGVGESFDELVARVWTPAFALEYDASS